MLAAGGYKIFEAFHHGIGAAQNENWKMVIIATLVAAVVSFIAVKWLLGYVQTHTFIAFGLYRIIVGGAILWFVIQVGAKPLLDHGQIAPVIVQHLVPVQFADGEIF
jgi:undecaprenyl pyrophosphate phosphatase UppP